MQKIILAVLAILAGCSSQEMHFQNLGSDGGGLDAWMVNRDNDARVDDDSYICVSGIRSSEDDIKSMVKGNRCQFHGVSVDNIHAKWIEKTVIEISYSGRDQGESLEGGVRNGDNVSIVSGTKLILRVRQTPFHAVHQ
jgi:hypothetical protein